MNGKQARQLRKTVEQEAQGLSEVEYVEREHSQRLVQVGVKSDGSAQYDVVTPKTRELAKDCQRRIYQKLKTLHHQYYGR